MYNRYNYVRRLYIAYTRIVSLARNPPKFYNFNLNKKFVYHLVDKLSFSFKLFFNFFKLANGDR